MQGRHHLRQPRERTMVILSWCHLMPCCLRIFSCTICTELPCTQKHSR